MKKIYLFLALAIAVAINANAEKFNLWYASKELNNLTQREFTKIADKTWTIDFGVDGITLTDDAEFTIVNDNGDHYKSKTSSPSYSWYNIDASGYNFKVAKGTYYGATLVESSQRGTVLVFHKAVPEGEQYELSTWNDGVLKEYNGRKFERIDANTSELVFDSPITVPAGDWSQEFVIKKGSETYKSPIHSYNAKKEWVGIYPYGEQKTEENFKLYPGTYYSVTIKGATVKFNTYAETTKGLDALLSKSADYVGIMTDIYVSHHWGGYYSICTTTEGSQAKQPILDEGKEQDIVKWGDNPENFAQLDWFRIADADKSLVEKQFQAGTIVSVADKKVVKLGTEATPVTFNQSLNIYRPISFTATDEEKEKFFLVTPQDGEKAIVRGRYNNIGENDYLADNNGHKVAFSNNTAVKFVDDDKQWYEVECYIVKNVNNNELELVVYGAQVATGVESVETANATVFAANGTINVSSEAQAAIEVYTANGQMVSAINADNASIAVAPGFYLVKVGNQVSKVVVK